MLFKNLSDFYYQYQKPLSSALFHISQKGILVHEKRLLEFKDHLNAEIFKECSKVEQIIGQKVIAKAPKYTKPDKLIVNLSSVPQVMKMLVGMGLKIPTSKGKKTTNETALQRIFSQSGNKVVESLLQVRELNKIGGYTNTELPDYIFYSIFNPTGTVTGRRSSRASWQTDNRSKIVVGGNAQNWPKHSALGKMFRKCLVARPGYIFVACDQIQAEDWIVQSIIYDQSGIDQGIKELINGVDRHKKLASIIFNLPEDKCGKDSIERYLGKKTRHAGNYGMRGKTMSEALAKEGKFVEEKFCNDLLNKFHKHEPWIQNVFQKYVEDTLNKYKILKTPVGRTRQFFSLRSFADNSSVYRDAYSYIPQGVVGDNTGLAIVSIFQSTNEELYIVNDAHDALTIECKDNEQSIRKSIDLLKIGFSRKFPFPNGFEIEIPIEFELGYSLGDMQTMDENKIGKRFEDVYPKLNKINYN